MTKILVVDDDPHLREVVRYALARQGWTIIEAADGVDEGGDGVREAATGQESHAEDNDERQDHTKSKAGAELVECLEFLAGGAGDEDRADDLAACAERLGDEDAHRGASTGRRERGECRGSAAGADIPTGSPGERLLNLSGV